MSLVAIDGTVVSSAQPSSPPPVDCGGVLAANVPLPVSTSNSRVYYMDAQGIVYFLAPNGDSGRATSMAWGSNLRSMFAVSPDDRRIGVVMASYAPTGTITVVYVEDLNSPTNLVTIFKGTAATTLWPVGWHGNNLVLAKVPACTNGGGPFSAGPQELHVVDPATGARRFTLGGPGCVIAGTPSTAGGICESRSFTQATVLDWTGAQAGGFPIGGPTPAYLSPDGHLVAVVSGPSTSIYRTNTTLNLVACGWIDSTHVISAGDVQQPRIGSIDGNLVPVNSLGTCGGRIPGGL